MSLIPILVLATASQKARAKSARRHIHHNQSKPRTRSSSLYDDPSHLDYILKEMAYGESLEMRDFFTKLFTYGEEIRKEMNERMQSQYQRKLDDINLQLANQIVILKEFEDRLQKSNIFFSQKSNTTIGRKCGGYYYRLFNGLIIYDFIVSNDDMSVNLKSTDEHFKEKKLKLEEKTSQVKNLELKRQRLLMEKDRLEQKLRFPFGKEKNMKRLAEIEKEVSEINDFISSTLILSEQVEHYEQLSDEQKIAIMEYIQEINHFCNIVSQYNQVFYNTPLYYSDVHLTFTYSYDEIDTDMWFKALSRMFERDNIDLSYLDKVFHQIEEAPDHWMNKDLEMCSRGPKDFATDCYKQLIYFFLENVYYPEYCDVLTRRVHYSDLADGEELDKVKTKVKK